MEVKLKKELNEFFVNKYVEKFSQKENELSEKDELIKELQKEIETYKRIDLVKFESSLTV